MAEPTTDDLAVRLPRQERSRQAWARVLDAGVTLLEEGGYEAFTIAAVCDRAGVAPPAIYARTSSKDALFLAVYDHGIARVEAVRAAVGQQAAGTGVAPPDVVRRTVAAVVEGMLDHRRFLRAVVLISAAHPEVQRRGSAHVRALGEAFVQAVAPVVDAGPDPTAAAWSCFGTVVASTVIRVAYGADFGTAAPVDDETFVVQVSESAVRALFHGPPG